MSATTLLPIKSTFQRYIDYVDIARHFTARWRKATVGWKKTRYLRAKCVNILKTVRGTSIVTIDD